MPTRSGLVEIDHLMCTVSDMPAAVTAMSRLGFRLTPESEIGGMSNRLAQLTPIRAGSANFFELMTINDRTRVPALMQEILSGPDGLKMIVHVCDDIESATRAFAYAEAPIGDTWHVEREWVSDDGLIEDVRFTVLIPQRGALPFFMNAYKPNSLSQYTQPKFQHHDNGALNIRRVYAVCPEGRLAEEVAKLETVYACVARRSADGSFTITPRDVVLDVSDPGLSAHRFEGAVPLPADASTLVGLQIAVVDLTHTERLLRANSISPICRPGRVVVRAEDACGMMIEFVQASETHCEATERGTGNEL
ncbi:VOC family protein [Amorphus sp. 3PC139-8]|uniref:VOC family protein n=1 Tax=Amorphus sp. 3PC139-8 TaxID=2735676 RepID=UPI00345D28A0